MKKKSFGKVIYWIFATLFIVTAVLTTVMMITFDKEYASPKFNNYILISITDKSMSPEIFKGSAVLTDLNKDKIKTGDCVIVLMKTAKGTEYTARKVTSEQDGQFTITGAKGANPFIATKSGIVGVKKIQFYGLGAFMDLVRTQPGFLAVIVLPLLIIIVVQIVRMALLLQSSKTDSDEDKKKKEDNV